MSGIESCTFACINVKCTLKLMPLENKKCYFNFGENKYCICSPKDMQYFFELSQIKANQTFDLKVTSHDKQFDNLFNFSLPRKIWEMWQNFDVDEKSDNRNLNTYEKEFNKAYSIEKQKNRINKIKEKLESYVGKKEFKIIIKKMEDILDENREI